MSFSSTVRAIAGCLLVSLVASIAFIVSEKTAAGQTAPTVIPGLIDQVIIRRDERGIPYIEPKTITIFTWHRVM